MEAADLPRGGPADGRVTGTVSSFDRDGGYGTVAASDGRGEWFFHCTAIADGTRAVEEGRAVSFEIVPGHLGRYEAVDVRPA